jgi:hypothetical protein
MRWRDEKSRRSRRWRQNGGSTASKCKRKRRRRRQHRGGRRMRRKKPSHHLQRHAEEGRGRLRQLHRLAWRRRSTPPRCFGQGQTLWRPCEREWRSVGGRRWQRQRRPQRQVPVEAPVPHRSPRPLAALLQVSVVPPWSPLRLRRRTRVRWRRCEGRSSSGGGRRRSSGCGAPPTLGRLELRRRPLLRRRRQRQSVPRAVTSPEVSMRRALCRWLHARRL